MKNYRRNILGFTLIELMVTIVIVAILMMVATPSFLEFQRNSELTSTANSVLASINATRGEAMKRNAFAMMVPQDGANWSSGWKVFVDKDLDQAFDAAKDEIITTQGPLPSYLAISGTGIAGGGAPYILYNGSGYSRDKAGAFGAVTLSLARSDVASANADAQTRRIKIANTGRTRVCKGSDPGCDATD